MSGRRTRTLSFEDSALPASRGSHWHRHQRQWPQPAGLCARGREGEPRSRTDCSRWTKA